ncbi:hypothetical protein KR032_007216 [Drosophila birchii]|nr:hypothetical protein KR032_007216 [Drosophila birchii]
MPSWVPSGVGSSIRVAAVCPRRFRWRPPRLFHFRLGLRIRSRRARRLWASASSVATADSDFALPRRLLQLPNRGCCLLQRLDYLVDHGHHFHESPANLLLDCLADVFRRRCPMRLVRLGHRSVHRGGDFTRDYSTWGRHVPAVSCCPASGSSCRFILRTF